MKNTRAALFSQTAAVLWLSTLPIIAHADPPSISPGGTINSASPLIDTDGGTTGLLNSFYDTVVTNLYWFVGVIAVIYIVWNGIQYIMSNGDAEKAKKARNAIINAVIGIVIVVSLYSIISLAYGISKNLTN